MTEQELKSLLKAYGWTMGKQATGLKHAYSAKKYIRQKSGSITRYIGTTNKLAGMSAADVLGKLKE